MIATLMLSSLAGPPPTMAIVNALDANATKFFNMTVGAPGSCSCQSPNVRN